MALTHKTYVHWSGLDVGLNWFTTSSGITWHNGAVYGGSSFIGFDPAAHEAVVLLTDTCTLGTPTSVWSDLTTSLGLLLAQWMQGVTPPPLTTLLPNLGTLTPAQLQAFTGSYTFSGAPSALVVTLDGDTLSADADWLWPYAVDLYPTGANSFVIRVTGGTLTFTAGPDGGVSQAVLNIDGQMLTGTR